MKIYRKALSNHNIEKLKKHNHSLPFDEIFGEGNLRVVIPMASEKAQFILDSLQEGKTKSKTSYKVDVEQKVAYRYIVNEEGESRLDPRPMRLGKVIRRELGDKWADAWSVEANSSGSEGRSVVLSRSPIDILRMSDHGWWSCHTPGGSYFEHAIEEAMDGGAIAYVVDNQALESFFQNNIDGELALQQEEIFEDSERRVKGVKPISRIRINRYSDEYENSPDVAMPITRQYGEDVSGFLDTVTSWLKNKQSEYIDWDEVSISDYQRNGGSYADESDSDIIENFFGDNQGVNHDLRHKSGQSRIEIWEEELTEMMEDINGKLENSSVYGSVDASDGEAYIYSGGEVVFHFRGYMTETPDWDVEKEIKDNEGFQLENQVGHWEDTEYENKNGVATVSLRIRFDYNESITDPDDFKDKAEALINYERDWYHTDAEVLQAELIQRGFLVNHDSIDDWQPYMEKFENSEAEFNISSDEDTVDIYVNTKIPISISNVVIRDELKSVAEEAFSQSVKSRVASYVIRDQGQEQFPFYQEMEVDVQHDMDVSQVVPSFSIASLRSDIVSLVISIPIHEMYRLGKTYFDALFALYGEISQDVTIAVQQFMTNQIERFTVAPSKSTTEIEVDNGIQQASKHNWYSFCKISTYIERNI